jgi:hypothetical protein
MAYTANAATIRAFHYFFSSFFDGIRRREERERGNEGKILKIDKVVA